MVGSRALGLGMKGARGRRRTDGGQTIPLIDHTESKRRVHQSSDSFIPRTANVCGARCSYNAGPRRQLFVATTRAPRPFVMLRRYHADA